MDYDSFQRILDAHGISNEPAFKDLSVEIAPIPADENGKRALGLYFPEDKLIVIPPELSPNPGAIGESVELHELGHRFGHYHYNNLTEQFAEDYRQKYQGKLEYHFHENNGVT
jgi:hypothetical protein